MWLQRAQFRGVLLPLSVAAGSMLALAWYGFVWIPAQQSYFNARNLRLLRTMAADIKAKVDNFDLAVDHAFESFKSFEVDPQSPTWQAQFDTYVRDFAPDLEVLLPEDRVDAARLLRTIPSDPPTMTSPFSSP